MKRFMVPWARQITVAFLCLAWSAQARADEPPRDRAVFAFGGFLGGGFVDWMGAGADGDVPGEVTVAKPGFCIGLLATLDLSALLSLDIEPLQLAVQPELAYTAKGSGFRLEGVDSRYSVALAYLQASLLARVEYATARSITPYMLLGPGLGYLNSAVFKNRFGGTSNIKDNLKSTDVGLVLGVGAMYALPPWGSLGLELRADLGLVSIDGQGDGDEIRNAALSLLLVYSY